MGEEKRVVWVVCVLLQSRCSDQPVYDETMCLLRIGLTLTIARQCNATRMYSRCWTSVNFNASSRSTACL